MTESLSKRLRKPLAAATAVGLASASLAGCGGGDKTFNFKVLCADNGDQLRIVDTDQPSQEKDEYTDDRIDTDGTASLSCESPDSLYSAPISIQLDELSGGDDVRYNSTANYLVKVVVDQAGTFGESDNQATAEFDTTPQDIKGISTLTFNNVDSIRQIDISPISAQ